jgi:hypothetical protein
MINSCKNDHSMEVGNAHISPWSQSQYHQPICKMRNGTCIKYMVQKMLSCFTNISPEILWHSFRLDKGVLIAGSVIRLRVLSYIHKSRMT